jgi:hypothetical protein
MKSTEHKNSSAIQHPSQSSWQMKRENLNKAKEAMNNTINSIGLKDR